MSTSEKVIDKLIDTATDGLMAVGSFLDSVEKITARWESPNATDGGVSHRNDEAETPVTHGMAEPSAHHAFDSDNSRLVESLKTQVADLEAQQRWDVSRLAELVSQKEQVSRQLAHASLRNERISYTRPQMRFEDGGSRKVWFLHSVVSNIDGTDVIVKNEQGEERRLPLRQWQTWEVV